jgi:hypothetical protein
MPVNPPKIGIVDGQAEPAGIAIAALLIGKHYRDEPLIGTASLIQPGCDFKVLILAFN